MAGSSFELSKSTHSSPLLSLPRELRDLVYSHLLQGKQFTFTQHSLIFTVSYDRHEVSDTDQKLPLWLLTSHQVLSEGLQQFYREATCVSCRTTSALGYLRLKKRYIAQKEDQEKKPLESPSRFRLPLLNAHCIRSLILDDLRLDDYASWPVRDTATLYISTIDVLVPLTRCLKLYPGSSLHTLKLTLTLPTSYVSVFDAENWTVDLEPLGQMGRLKCVEVTVIQPSLLKSKPDIHKNERACSAATRRMNEEVVKLVTGLKGESTPTTSCISSESQGSRDVNLAVRRGD